MPDAVLQIPPLDVAATERLADELGVSFALAQVLMRRGHDDLASARAWLAADTRHDVAGFDGLDRAVATIVAAIERGDTITVHGDYDADGVCSTAILVSTLRAVGADVRWHLPSRDDGYGLSEQGVKRLAEHGTDLLICVDCGITAVDEVAQAIELGVAVVVVDHHAPRADGRLPDAPIVHPAVCGYPCPDLCATAVAYKLSTALHAAVGQDPARADEQLDLVAIATVADCVPLVDENRRLVRDGLAALSRTGRPGLRALMDVAGVEPGKMTARDIGFRIAPRINAVGRVGRPDAALELLLTGDEQRAREIATELDDANGRRRFLEQRMRQEAEAQVRALGPQPAYVLWSEQWHAGVIGVVASRIAEREHRPVVLVALDGEGGGTGSGRSIPAYDLLAGLTACAADLERFGGHRAAAGCTVAADRLEELRAGLCAHAAATLSADDLRRVEPVDAVVGGDEIGFDLAEELERLAPFGTGNREVSLLVRAARLVDERSIGSGRHTRFSVASGGARAEAVGFGWERLPDGVADGRFDATFALELNEYRGAVEPRLVLRELIAAGDAAPEIVGEPEHGSVAWTELVAREAARLAPVAVAVAVGTDGAPAGPGEADGGRGGSSSAARPMAAIRDRRGRSAAATIAALVAGGERVLVVCADAWMRREQMRGRLGGFAICSWGAVERDPALAGAARHLVLLDPPLHAGQRAVIEEIGAVATIHLAWGAAELRCSSDHVDRELPSRDHLASGYRALREGASLAVALPGRSWWCAAGDVAVLAELGLVRLSGDGTVMVPPAERVDLEQSAVLRRLRAECEERRRWLTSLTESETTPLAA